MNTSAAFYQSQDDIVREAAREFGPWIKRVAYLNAAGDVELAQDLEQEALIKLWDLDPTRFDSDDRGWLETVLRNCMIDLARVDYRERLHDRCISLYTPVARRE